MWWATRPTGNCRPARCVCEDCAHNHRPTQHRSCRGRRPGRRGLLGVFPLLGRLALVGALALNLALRRAAPVAADLFCARCVRKRPIFCEANLSVTEARAMHSKRRRICANRRLCARFICSIQSDVMLGASANSRALRSEATSPMVSKRSRSTTRCRCYLSALYTRGARNRYNNQYRC